MLSKRELGVFSSYGIFCQPYHVENNGNVLDESKDSSKRSLLRCAAFEGDIETTSVAVKSFKKSHSNLSKLILSK